MTSSHTPRLPIQAPEGIKSPVATATIEHIELFGLLIVNGYQLNVNDRVLVKNQTDPAQNGIYSAQEREWVRAKDWKVSQQIANGVMVLDVNTGVLWSSAFAGVLNVGVTPVNFTLVAEGEDTLRDELAAIDSTVLVGGVESSIIAGITTEELIASIRSSKSDDVITTTGFSSAGDGGPAQWKAASTTGLTLNQSPSDRVNAELVDGTGRLWVLVSESGEVDLKSIGAACDGSTDDTLALQAAEAAPQISTIVVSGETLITADVRPRTPILYKGAKITRVGGFYPRSATSYSGYHNKDFSNFYSYKYMGQSDMPSLGGGGYYQPKFSQQMRLEYANQAGFVDEETGTATGIEQVWLNGTHLGENDFYNLFCAMSVAPYAPVTPVEWGEQPSAGMINGQNNAMGNKVNLYGFGDVVLRDTGYDDVAMFGHVTFLYKDGGDTGDYVVPRVGSLIGSIGLNNIDAHHAVSGKAYVGWDSSNATFSGAAIAVKEGHKIAWDATRPVAGKFSTGDVGNVFSYYDGSGFRNELGADRSNGWSLKGLSATATLSFGQIGTVSYITAASSSADNTTLIFRTASAGAESTRLQIASSGTVQPGADSSQSFGTASLRWGNVFSSNFRPGSGAPVWTSGAGSPEGVLSAVVGSMYTRTDGGAGTTLYVKESGTGNTGWVAK